MDDFPDTPRQWIEITLTLAAEIEEELEKALAEVADEVFLWRLQPVDPFLRHQREAHVRARHGVPDWVECP